MPQKDEVLPVAGIDVRFWSVGAGGLAAGKKEEGAGVDVSGLGFVEKSPFYGWLFYSAV